MDGQPVEQMQNGHLPVEHAPYDPAPTPAMDAPAPALVMTAAPEPVFASAPVPAPEPAPIPVTIVPTISADAPPEKPKRGWWRR